MDPSAFPVVDGEYQMTREWKLTLPGQFRRRFEEDALVLWRPGMTFWILVWGKEGGRSPREQLARIQQDASPDRYDAVEEADGPVLRWAYRLDEHHGDGRAPALYGFTLAATGHVQLAAYFDREEDAAAAAAVWRSVR